MIINNAGAMNRYKNILMAVLILMISVSCSTVEKITVYGTPGEKIYAPNKQQIATIPQNGKADIKLESDAYYGYLYTYQPNVDQWVPFALDVTKKTHGATKLAAGVGYTLTGIGVVGVLSGALMMAVDNSDDSDMMNTELAFLGAGLGITGAGAAIGMPASKRIGQLAYQYNFGYTSKQQTNADLSLGTYIMPEEVTENPTVRKKTKSEDVATSNYTSTSTGKTRKKSMNSESASSTESIAGEYKGSGTLATNGEVSEIFGSMKIIITPKDDTTVSVRILDDNGEDFFDSEDIFNVQKNSNGSFTLTDPQFPSVKFRITNKHRIEYSHPQVNINDSMYVLTVFASKQ